jgi:hypothetical protein
MSNDPAPQAPRGRNLLPETPATLLPEDERAHSALRGAAPGAEEQVAADHPTYGAAWAVLARRALDAGQTVTAYAYARTGYHRGLDQLRRSGWKGSGPVPWAHAPNQGFLRCLHLLALAADQIGEAGEAARCAQFLRDCDPAAADALTG